MLRNSGPASSTGALYLFAATYVLALLTTASIHAGAQVQETPEAHLARLFREPFVGASPTATSGPQGSFDNVIRSQLDELVQANKIYLAASRQIDAGAVIASQFLGVP
jgi:hypothetical protein